MPSLNRIVVVGGSLAGLRTVESLRRLGFAERILVIGAERHWPYDRPPLSKQLLAGEWDAERVTLRPPESYDELEAEWRLGRRAVALHPNAREVELDDDERVGFDGLVVATGATARRLEDLPLLEGLHVLRDLDDALALRRDLERSPRVAIIGAGFIGAEVAAVCRGRGLEVDLVEALPAPFAGVLGSAMGRYLAGLHRDEGVRLHCGVRVESFEGEKRVSAVRLEDGTRIAADVVVIGIGVEPETAWLADSGIHVDDGVMCDATCAASVESVYAVGDVARFEHPRLGRSVRLEHWTNAAEQASAAAENLLAGPGGARPYAPVPYFWTDQYRHKLQLVGLPDPGDAFELVEGAFGDHRFVGLYHRERRVTGVLGMNRARPVMRLRAQMRDADAGGLSLDAVRSLLAGHTPAPGGA